MKHAKLHLIKGGKQQGSSVNFISLGRNIELAKCPPERFVPTVKRSGDVVI